MRPSRHTVNASISCVCSTSSHPNMSILCHLRCYAKDHQAIENVIHWPICGQKLQIISWPKTVSGRLGDDELLVYWIRDITSWPDSFPGMFGNFHPQYTNVKVEGPSFPTSRASQIRGSFWSTNLHKYSTSQRWSFGVFNGFDVYKYEEIWVYRSMPKSNSSLCHDYSFGSSLITGSGGTRCQH